MLLGRTFFDNNLLNIAAVIFEILLFLGIYASPAIIIRFGISLKPMDVADAKKFSIIYSIIYIAALIVIALLFNLSILPVVFVAIWTCFSYGILIYQDGTDTNIIVKLFAKFNELAVYIIVGVITTAVAWGTFYLLSFVLDSNSPIQLAFNTVLNWCAGIVVSFPMNKHWVFHSKAEGKESFKEFVGFVASRISTLLIEEVVMILCVNVLKLDQYISKYVIASFLVIVLNYVFAKVFVFKKKEEI